MQFEGGSDETISGTSQDLDKAKASTGTPGSGCGAARPQPREEFPQHEVRRVAANQEMQMHALENTAQLKEQGWRALSHQPVAMP